MIKGIGVDIVELERIDRLVRRNSRFIGRTLTEREFVQYNELRSDRRKTEYLAGRFAAKEAFAKATGTGIGKLQFTDIEVLTTASGAPSLSVGSYESYRLHISISHSEHYAVAQVIIEEN